jgi:hypothetical protein
MVIMREGIQACVNRDSLPSFPQACTIAAESLVSLLPPSLLECAYHGLGAFRFKPTCTGCAATEWRPATWLSLSSSSSVSYSSSSISFPAIFVTVTCSRENSLLPLKMMMIWDRKFFWHHRTRHGTKKIQPRDPTGASRPPTPPRGRQDRKKRRSSICGKSKSSKREKSTGKKLNFPTCSFGIGQTF